MAFGIDDIIGNVLGIVDKFIPDPEARRKAEGELRSSLQDWDKAQMDVNKAEATSGVTMAATWRPAIGWVCAIALAFQFVLAPIGSWVAALAGVEMVPAPKLDGMLWELMFGMLGFGGLRTFEKIKGVAR